MKVKHSAWIDDLRFIVIILIALGHFYTWRGIQNRLDLIYLIVEFFPLVAGFTFMQSVRERQMSLSLPGYAAKRFKRLFPYTFLALIPLMIKQAFESTEPLLKQLLYAFPEASLLSYNGMNILWGTLNGPSWIILCIFLAELFLYAICTVCREKTVTNLILPVSVVWGYGYMAAGISGGQDEWGGFVTNGFFRAYIAICLGALVYYLSAKIKKMRWTEFGQGVLSAIELICYGATFALLIFCHLDHYADSSHRYVVTALLAVAIALSFSGATVTSRLKDGKLSRYLGKVSLSICVIHISVIQLFYWKFEAPQEHTLLFLVCVLLCSAVFQAMVELCIARGKRIARRLKEKALAPNME